jgi:hypothetical protein
MAKHKYIETPEELWQFFQNYKGVVKNNPRKRMVFVGKDGAKQYEELERPLTLEGFSNFLRAACGLKDVWHYFTESQKDDTSYSEYLDICRAIRDEIKQDQIEGGMVGQYNPSITQRLNGLVEKQHVDSNIDVKGLPINIITNSPPLANDEK